MPRVSGLRALPRSFYLRPADRVARDLVGRYLVREIGGERLVLRVVETEAYLGAKDRASHAWNGRRTARNEALYLGGGHAYVYFVYGMHWCLNAVTGPEDHAEAVLIRAGEPVAGEAEMRRRRGIRGPARPGEVAGGPARLCEALGVDRAANALPLWRGPLRLCAGEPAQRGEVVVTPRIGVDYAGEAAGWPLRYSLAGNPHVSRPRPAAR
jgi:DNA-3-methyladenine glycosylase